MKTQITIEYDGKCEAFENFLKEKLALAHDWGLWCNTTFKYSEDEDLSRNSLIDLNDRVAILDKKYNALFNGIAGSDGIMGRLSQIETWVKNYEKVKNGII